MADGTQGTGKLPRTEDPVKGLVPGAVDYVLQHHRTRRNPTRPHYDLRLGTPDTGLYSWALPRARFPGVKERVLAPQTTLHDYAYGGYQGPLAGGEVRIHDRGKARITRVTPRTISFALDGEHRRGKYTLVRIGTGRGKRDWLFIRQPDEVKEKADMKLIPGETVKSALARTMLKRGQYKYVPQFAEYLKQQEGFRPARYPDARNTTAIGYGHQITAKSPGLIQSITGAPFTDSTRLTREHANRLLHHDITNKVNTVQRLIPDFAKEPKEVQLHLLSETFRSMLPQSPKTIALINAKKYGDAAKEFLRADDYLRASQPGSPTRGVKARMDALADALRKRQEALNSGVSALINRWRSSVKTAELIKEVPLKIVTPVGKERAKIKAELADTPETRRKGLSKRAALPADRGMLFDTPGPFWMKDVNFPLDIIFMDKQGGVLKIGHMPAPPKIVNHLPDHLLPTYRSDVPGTALALEVPAGWAKRAGVRVGDRLRLDNTTDA